MVVAEAIERGWDGLVSGELPLVAEAAGFEVLLTTDKNLVLQDRIQLVDSCCFGARTNQFLLSRLCLDFRGFQTIDAP